MGRAHRILKNDWADRIGHQFEQPYYANLRQFLIREYRTGVVYPDMHDIFNALHYTPFSGTKAVILGQDPYHGPGQAHGLSFSVQRGVEPPPSLQNIFKELKDDIGCPTPDHGCLEGWARQGVLLLNAVLTVRRGRADSHRGRGWEQFTDGIIETLNGREDPMVFILWGQRARAKKTMIDGSRHLIIESPHPSPLSAHRGFFGSRPFSRANAFLERHGMEPIDWSDFSHGGRRSAGEDRQAAEGG